MKIAIVLGTRPEIIKMSPIIRECEREKLEYFILHTGQHYSHEMDGAFFEELELPEPKYNLDIGSGSHGEQTGKMLMALEKILAEERPDMVLVEGDTNTSLAGTLAAVKMDIRVGHIEAGMRSYDRTMPEEVNRILVDHIADYRFAPSVNARNIMLGEGIPADTIFVTGNTIVQAVHDHLEIAERRAHVLAVLGLVKEGYFLATSHRQENVDAPRRLKGILDGLQLVQQEFSLPVIFPVHPRTRKRIVEFGLEVGSGIRLIEPVGFLEFLQLEQYARLILTDSGGVQMEACILSVPCVTLRDNTEWTETIEVGANVLSGCEPDRILESVKLMLGRERDWSNPFGDETSAVRTLICLLGASRLVHA
ncbi:MAG TPA: UDP-N-acetylglucosamine 2-epimerase (non-hydrolyzing) [Dehalococcoidia bacterium]|nr:UDP-N-acetylglucosamine 2-epimerase (non-hydrolyzing) [Dehalococcoidia bacterium]